MPAVLTVVAALIGGYEIVLHPKRMLLLMVAALLAAIYLRRPQWLVTIVLVLAFLTVPAQVKQSWHPGPYAIQYYQLMLLPCAVWVTTSLKPPARAVGALALLLGLTGLGVAVALVAGNDAEAMLKEAQNVIALGLAMYVAAAVVGTSYQRGYVRAVAVILWVSLVELVVASAGGLPLAGREETAHIGASVSDAARLLTNTQSLALAVACLCLALALQGTTSVRSVLPWLLPALGVLLLAFSRNTVLGLGVAVLFTALARRESGVKVIARALMLVLVAAPVLAIVFVLFSQTSVGPYLERQATGFQTRVIGGLSSQALQTDPSVLARRRENTEMKASIGVSDPVGHGWGHAYQPGYGASGGFEATIGRYYGHQFYLWLLVKTGYVGMFIWALIVLPPVLRSLGRAATALAVAGGATLAGLSAIMIYSPIVEDSYGAPLFGLVLGITIGVLYRKPAVDDPTPAAPATTQTPRSKALAGR